MLRLDAYIRVSKVGGRAGESFISPDVQRDQITAAAALMGAIIVAEHLDLDQSGGKSDRPGWQKAISRVEAGHTGGIIVAKLDRFARSTLDAAEALRRIEAAGGHFASAAERFDTTSPFGRFALTVMFALAELELGRHREQWAISTERSIKRGAHTVVPYGYRRGAGKRLEVDAPAAEAVREVFRRRLAGQSWTEIIDGLNAAGIRPARAAAWSRPAVKRIIANRAYLGEAFYGRHREAEAHEALVSEPDWQTAQIVAPPRKSRRENGGALCSGLIRCAACSYRMQNSMSGSGSTRARVYRCDPRHGGGRCPAPATITQRLLDEFVEAQFLSRVGELRVAAAPKEDALSPALAELGEHEAELIAWRDDLRIREAVGHEHYLAGLSTRAEALEACRARVAAIRSERAATITDVAVWPTLSVPERRRVISAGIDAVFVFRGRGAVADRVRVVWAGEAPYTLSVQGRPATARAFDDKPAQTAAPRVEDRKHSGDHGIVEIGHQCEPPCVICLSAA